MHRVLISPEAVQGKTLTVKDREQLHHLRRVLRITVGEPLEAFDGQGRAYAGTVKRVADDGVTVAIDTQRHEAPPRVRIRLAQALIKPARFAWLLEKATELGVTDIIPLQTARTTARPPADRQGTRTRRWERIIEGAASQCGRATLPAILPPRRLTEFLPELTGHLALMPTLVEEGVPCSVGFSALNGTDEVVLLIGPEGDFTPEEMAAAKRCGAKPISLGRRTLRSETAAVAAVTLLQHTLGEL